MADIFGLLADVRKRPGMYLGGDDAHRLVQLRNLELWLLGYSNALANHGIQEPGVHFLRDFGEHLRHTRGWSTSCGPIDAIVRGTSDESEAWDMLWKLIDEFRDHGASI